MRVKSSVCSADTMGDSMILSEPDDTHMTLFNPDDELLELVKLIASGEGLFVERRDVQEG
jgi:hypothetical protein